MHVGAACPACDMHHVMLAERKESTRHIKTCGSLSSVCACHYIKTWSTASYVTAETCACLLCDETCCGTLTLTAAASSHEDENATTCLSHTRLKSGTRQATAIAASARTACTSHFTRHTHSSATPRYHTISFTHLALEHAVPRVNLHLHLCVLGL